MRTPITLQEFLFTLNQNKDIFVRLIDYEKDECICSCWKSCLLFSSDGYGLKYQKYKDWFVQDFIITTFEGFIINIVEKLKEE